MARDTVHMMLVDWQFIGKDGDPVNSVSKDSEQLLLDNIADDPNAPIAADDVFFKNKIDGLPTDDVDSLKVTSDSISSDYYMDTFSSSSTSTESSDWAALYTPADGEDDLTSSQIADLKNANQLNVVHNPDGDAKLQTKGGDAFTRKIAGKQQDDAQKIYDLL